ncbi:H(+)-transporting V0 sector ATPase subunit D [Pichia kluyveri]|uniref:V-type proton ATPase subunit n=1 Tax=Pichia kluyveri TaxID=36015 RepID=A0AAV5R5C4_PICKL|nr:H(+)-transporting V0 sector ATPase subunit D [Pichia kluyveri]
MEGLFFNIDNGYIEGLVRGYKNTLLTSSQYVNLTQCDTLEDIKLQLGATEYSSVLSDINETLSTSLIERKLNNKLIEEFTYIKSQSNSTLTKFLEFMKYGYMIDNILLIISGTIHNRDKSEILKKCNALGWFETLPTLTIATDLTSLYETVLIDTPLAKYFQSCLSIDDLDDLNIEIIRNILYKEYLEDFNNFAKNELPTPSNEIMERIINFEADKRSINISINSLDTELSTEDKLKMLPNIGLLSSNENIKHQLASITDLENLQVLISSIGIYKDIFNESTANSNDENGKSLEDFFYEYEMRLNKDAFTQQFTFSTVWAYIKSKEQEIRNITWICECIAQNQRDKINNYISVY